MVKSSAETVEEYLNELPAEKRKVVKKLRDVILENLPEGYEETMNWGMISYEVPLARYPDTYNNKPLMFAAVAAQKNYFSLYLTPVYQSSEREKWLREQYEKEGLKIDMGKSCLRFKSIEDIPLSAIGELISEVSVEEFIELYEESRNK
jgi:uncharacterized protein YdhG (YjbR/CyaY superfamily)